MSDHPYEADIGVYLSSPPLSEDPRNHCCPIYAVLHPPEDDNVAILVMPFLREHNNPPYTTVGEVIEFFRQVLEVRHLYQFLRLRSYQSQGIYYMHLQHIAHRYVATLEVLRMTY